MSGGDRSRDEVAAAVKGLAGTGTADVIAIAPGDRFSAEELGDLGREFGPVGSVVVLAQHIVDPAQTVRVRSGETYQDSVFSASLGDALLRHTCWRVVELLRESGCRAAIPRNMRYGGDGPRHSISYKKAAALAGLGAIGKNLLLINPEWGPWLYLRTVVTDADLPADAPITFSPCEGCARCLEACPGGALSETGIDRPKCEHGLRGEGDEARGALRLSPLGSVNCEECMRACPVGEAPPRLQTGGG